MFAFICVIVFHHSIAHKLKLTTARVLFYWFLSAMNIYWIPSAFYCMLKFLMINHYKTFLTDYSVVGFIAIVSLLIYTVFFFLHHIRLIKQLIVRYNQRKIKENENPVCPCFCPMCGLGFFGLQVHYLSRPERSRWFWARSWSRQKPMAANRAEMFISNRVPPNSLVYFL